jgi:hypothetical protein
LIDLEIGNRFLEKKKLSQDETFVDRKYLRREKFWKKKSSKLTRSFLFEDFSSLLKLLCIHNQLIVKEEKIVTK